MIERRAILLAGLGLGLCVEARSGGPERAALRDAEGAAAQGEGASARPKEGDLLIKVGDASSTPLTPAIRPDGDGFALAWNEYQPETVEIHDGSSEVFFLSVR